MIYLFLLYASAEQAKKGDGYGQFLTIDSANSLTHAKQLFTRRICLSWPGLPRLVPVHRWGKTTYYGSADDRCIRLYWNEKTMDFSWVVIQGKEAA